MESGLKILKILNVFEGEFPVSQSRPGYKKRYSDCFVHYLCGEAEYDFGDYSIRVSPDNFFYLAKNSGYEIHVYKPSKYICIDFEFEEGQKDRRSAVFQNRSVWLKSEFEKLFRSWNMPSAWREPYIYSGVYNLYAEALKTEQKQYAKSNPRLEEITNLIFDHYCESDFCVGSISEKTNLSEMHVRRILKSGLDVSPIEYILHLRLEKAKALLSSSGYSVSDVAAAVGISDPYYFSRLFKSKMGMTPLEYRKMYRSMNKKDDEK